MVLFASNAFVAASRVVVGVDAPAPASFTAAASLGGFMGVAFLAAAVVAVVPDAAAVVAIRHSRCCCFCCSWCSSCKSSFHTVKKHFNKQVKATNVSGKYFCRETQDSLTVRSHSQFPRRRKKEEKVFKY